MTLRRARLPRLAVPLAGLLGAALFAGPAIPALSAPNVAAEPDPLPAQYDPTKTEAFSAEATGLADLDRRAAAVAPTALQRQKADALKASVRWNRYGTPSSVLPADGLLAPRTGTAVETARRWLKANAPLFGGLDVIASLRLVNDQTMTRGSTGHAVLFRQNFGALTSAVDGMVTVGVSDRGVVYASSSLTKATASLTPQDKTLTPQQAWLTAASSVGIDKVAADLGSLGSRAGFTEFTVAGIEQAQQVRLRAVAMSNSSVRPVYETNVINNNSSTGEVAAYTLFVDAHTGRVLVRHNKVANHADHADLADGMAMETTPGTFSGSYTATECGPAHEVPVTPGAKSIFAVATPAITSDDTELNVLKNGTIVASGDTGTSPEAVTYTEDDGLDLNAVYAVQVCPFQGSVNPVTVGGPYVGTYVVSDQGTPTPTELQSQPAWKVFAANPSLNFSPEAGAGPRQTMCWVKFNVAEDIGPCPARYRLNNLASRAPYDVQPNVFLPTFTTSGNNAETREAWASPLTPGGLNQRPFQPDRTYNDSFTDAWNNTQCSNDAFLPNNNNNDILAATTTLFVGHNRFHDYAYYLGFTEDNYNLQVNNYGNLGIGGDPEIGNSQAGALSGGQPSFLGRDNANQITLQDGVPGITNQYLFQPIQAAFYSPCADGDLEAGIFGHEYTHAISNRMVGGPDQGLTGFQARSLGEAYSDAVALEYLFAHDYSQGTSPWVLGAYATGNPDTGIRNYALNRNPLQFGDIGYDTPGPEFHSDGEVWNAAMWEVRERLVSKYNAEFPYTNKRLQVRCASGFRGTRSPHGPLPPYKCPGNNRWIALTFDSFLLQQGTTDMVDARNAYLAADLLRFNGNNQAAIWDGFASVGLGKGAKTSPEDDEPTPSYASPLGQEGTMRVKAVDGAKTVRGELFVSRYEARITPVADTLSTTKLADRLPMVPGTYNFVFRAPGYGITRFRSTVKAGQTLLKTLKLKPNLASYIKGARIDGTSGEGDEATSRNPNFLIDDTEASNWGVMTDENIDVTQPVINVDLAGSVHTVRSVRVSALLRPVQAADEGPQGPEQIGGVTDDPDSGSRFTAMRQFAIEVCTQSGSTDCSGIGSDGYKRIFTSTEDAFNSVQPRPLAPTQLLRTFNVPDTRATHVRLVMLDNQCTGQEQYEGEQDNDLLNDTDCNASDRATIGHAAELQVFG